MRVGLNSPAALTAAFGLTGQFAASDVGGVGGRDVVHASGHPIPGTEADVGRITRWGKMIGNHHLGAGPPRQVGLLKGANMAFRREALAMPMNLKGAGAQVHQEVSMCLWACQRGWKLIYDPTVIVDHYPAPRFDADRRDRPEAVAIRDAAYNYTFSLLSFAPELLLRRSLYGLLVGDRGTPGLGRAFAGILRGERDVLRRLPASLVGQVEALAAIARGRRLEMATFSQERDS